MRRFAIQTVLAFNLIALSIGSAHAGFFRYQYNAKFVCGVFPAGAERLVGGDYASAVNILNPNCRPVLVRLRLSLTFPSDSLEPLEPGPVSDWISVRLEPGEAVEIDCGEIPDSFFEDPPDSPALKGFLTAQTYRKLQVTAVYTAGGPNNVRGIDVVNVPSIRTRAFGRHLRR